MSCPRAYSSSWLRRRALPFVRRMFSCCARSTIAFRFSVLTLCATSAQNFLRGKASARPPRQQASPHPASGGATRRRASRGGGAPVVHQQQVKVGGVVHNVLEEACSASTGGGPPCQAVLGTGAWPRLLLLRPWCPSRTRRRGKAGHRWWVRRQGAAATEVTARAGRKCVQDAREGEGGGRRGTPLGSMCFVFLLEP